MNRTRHIPRIALCLLAGVAISYGVAWWFEYERTSRILMTFDFLPLGTPVLQTGPCEWPVPPVRWPETMTPPSAPDRAFIATESAGTEYRSFIGHNTTFWRIQANEVASGWPMRCAARLSFLQEHISVYPGSPMPDTRVWYGGWYAFDIDRATNQAVLGPLEVRLPLRPLSGGLAVNTVFYGSLIAAIAWLVGSVARANRRRRGLCEACKYPHGASPVCTECGKPGGPA